MATQIWLSASSPLFTYSASPLLPQTFAAGAWNASTIEGMPSGNDTAYTIAAPGGVVLPSMAVYSTGQLTSSLAIGSTPTNGTPWSSGQSFTPAGDAKQVFHLDVQCGAGTGDCSQAPLTFFGAWLGVDAVAGAASASPFNATAMNVTLDDSSPAVTYRGFTTASQSNDSLIHVTQDDFNNTLSMTSTNGASASVRFQATTIALYAPTSPSLTPFIATLDNATLTSSGLTNLTARSAIEVHNNLILFASGLDPLAEHTLVIAAGADEQGRTGLVIDRWVIWGPEGQTRFIGATSATPPATTPIPAPSDTGGTGAGQAAGSAGVANVGAIIGGIIGALLALALLFWAFRRARNGSAGAAPKPEEKKLNPWDQANLLQNMKNEEVHVTTVANQRYVYPGLIAHSDLSK